MRPTDSGIDAVTSDATTETRRTRRQYMAWQRTRSAMGHWVQIAVITVVSDIGDTWSPNMEPEMIPPIVATIM